MTIFVKLILNFVSIFESNKQFLGNLLKINIILCVKSGMQIAFGNKALFCYWSSINNAFSFTLTVLECSYRSDCCLARLKLQGGKKFSDDNTCSSRGYL
jgi:hypothetical protein